MNWQPVVLFCNKCEAVITPSTVSFRADGMFAMEGSCPHGHGVFQHSLTIEEMMVFCHEADGRSLETRKKGN